MNHSMIAGDLEHATSAFTELFGQPLDLWIHAGDEWRHADGVQHRVAADSLESIRRESLPPIRGAEFQPVVEELSPGLFRVDARVNLATERHTEMGRSLVIAGTVRITSSRLISSLLRLSAQRDRLAKEIQEGYSQLAPHLEQISHDFEELNWLKHLSEQVDLVNVCDPLAQMAKGILPDLRLLVRAEGMVLVNATPNDDPHDSRPRVGTPLLWSGEKLLDDRACVQFIDELRREAEMGRPLIVNGHGSRFGHHLPPSIRSCVQIPITHRGDCHGWLVALNRNINQLSTISPEQRRQNLLGYDEFGTAEATLMNSAAVTLATHAHSAALFREKEFLLIGIIRTLISALDAKDVYTCGHSDRVATTGRLIGEQMGLESIECERLYMSGLLHDIGKIGIPDHVLQKPGKLSEEEFEIIKRHPVIGHAILNHLPQLRPVLPGVLYHHESLDGRGYPEGLQGDAIPLFGRILAVADAFDAMTSDRPYRPGMPVGKAVDILNKGADRQWDARVVNAFMTVLPAVEMATRDSSSRARRLLEQSSQMEMSIDQGVTERITRAVVFAHSAPAAGKA